MMVAFAATAFAADVKFSGSYEVSGQMEKNYGLLSDDVVSNQYYDHDFDLWMKVAVDKDTFFNTKIEVLDQVWADTQDAGEQGITDETQLQVERAWMGHKFGSTLLEVGVMDGGAWGYTFGDDKTNKYRIKATFDVAGGKLGMFAQKNKENGSENNVTKDNENDDSDTYSINYKGTFGGVMVAPMLAYTIDSSTVDDDDSDGTKTLQFDIAAGGKFGAVTVEAEYDYKKIEIDNSDNDYSIYGAFVNANMKLGAATIGFLTAYASVDEDTQNAYDMEDDFDSTFILGDALGVGGGDDLTGYWANAVYALYDVNDKLGLMAKYAYATSNFDDDDTSAWEFDASASYAITKELSYTVNFGYAKVDLDGADDPDAAMLLEHTLALKF